MFRIVNRSVFLFKSLVITGVVTVFIAGCSKFTTKDNVEPPTKLKPVKSEINIRSVWDQDTGVGTARLSFRIRPAIVGGVVYTVDVRGRVNAFTLKTGKKLWSTELKKPVSSGPTVAEGLLVVGTTDGEVIALDKKAGKKRWLARVSSEVLAAPLIEEGVVVVRTINGILEGLKVEDGKSAWIYRRRAPLLTMRGNSSPVAWKGLLYVGFDDGKMACIKTTSGRLIWEQAITLIRGRTELERLVDIDSDPVVSNGILYVVTFQGKLAAINIRARQLLWSRKLSSFKNITVDGSRVFVTDEQSRVWAFDSQTGVAIWKQEGLLHRKLTGPAASENYVIVGDFDGYLHWLDKADGSVVARIRGDKKGFIEAPIAVSGYVVSLGRGGELSVHKEAPLKKK